MGGAPRQHSSQPRHSDGPRRSAATNATIIGTQIHGKMNSASPARVDSAISGRKRVAPARPPWTANDAQPCIAFHRITGLNSAKATSAATYGSGRASQCRCARLVSRNTNAPPIVSTAEYLDSKARPAQIPAPSHQARPRSAPRSAMACIRHSAAPSNAQSSGPSGNTQVALVTPSTGDRLNANAAQNPTRSLAVAVPSRNISQVDSADSAINGSRTASADSPKTCAAPQDSHQAAGGWSK